MKKRTIGIAYFSKNLDIHEMNEELEGDLSAHVVTKDIPYSGETLLIQFNKCEYSVGCLSNIQLKPGIKEKDIVGNVCGRIKQVKQRRRRMRCNGEVLGSELNNAFKCTIFSEKYIGDNIPNEQK